MFQWQTRSYRTLWEFCFPPDCSKHWEARGLKLLKEHLRTKCYCFVLVWICFVLLWALLVSLVWGFVSAFMLHEFCKRAGEQHMVGVEKLQVQVRGGRRQWVIPFVFLERRRARSSSQTKAVYYLVLPLLVPGSQNQGVYRGEALQILPTPLCHFWPQHLQASPSQSATPTPASPALAFCFLWTPKHGSSLPLHAALNCKFSYFVLSDQSIRFSGSMTMTPISFKPQNTRLETKHTGGLTTRKSDLVSLKTVSNQIYGQVQTF